MNRARDWLLQAEKDLETAEIARNAGRHEWACFATQQAAEKAVKALHLHLGQEAWGHLVARLLKELPFRCPRSWWRRPAIWMGSISLPATPTPSPRGLWRSTTDPCRARMP